MPRTARMHYMSLKSSLINLPISIYGPLVERNVRPQHLAVHLRSSKNGDEVNDVSPVEAYVGWTGMAAVSSLAHFNAGERGFETLDMDPQYAQSLGFAEGSLVEVGLLHELAFAKTVGIEPLSSDDWEITELHADHLESTFLSQVRVARAGQEIDVWVLGRTRVRLRIVDVDSNPDKVLLLTTNTEVHIAPKRRAKVRSLASLSRNITAAKLSSPPSSRATADIPTARLSLRVLPSEFSPRPLPQWDGPESIGYVSPSTYARLNGNGSRLLNARIKRLPAPREPAASSDSVPPPAEPKNASGNDQEHIYLSAIAELPDRQIILLKPAVGIMNWDLLRQHSVPLAGVSDVLKKCNSFCIRTMLLHSTMRSVRGVPALLLTGGTGTGKTSISSYVARCLQSDPRVHAFVYHVDACTYAQKPVPQVKSLMQYWYDKARWHRPSILVLDNLDALISVELEHADSFRSRQLAAIFTAIFSSAAKSTSPDTRGMILLATASSSTSLHPILTQSHVFKATVHIRSLNRDSRKEILSHLVEERIRHSDGLRIDETSPLNYNALATQTEGYSVSDLKDFVSRAVHQAAMKSIALSGDVILTPEVFETAQADFVPLSLRSIGLQRPDTVWADIGGLEEVKRILRETLEWPTKYGPIFAQAPLRLRSGLLLYGYPGCGKTLLASAVAKECGLNFISVKGPEILNKYIGASEKSVRELFERATAAKPCVLFFDEFDSIAPKRGHDSTGVTDRVVNQLLTQMDGAEGLDGVYVLAATSRPDLIDAALLRPGRLDKSVLCNMPDKNERSSILRAVSRKVTLADSVHLDEIAEATEGFSGADLQALISNAQLEVVHASLAHGASSSSEADREEEASLEYVSFGNSSEDNKQVSSRAEETMFQKRLRQIQNSSRGAQRNKPKVQRFPVKHEITHENLLRALGTARSSISPEERRRLDHIYRSFVSDRGSLPAPPEDGAVGSRVTLM
ncbi:AAA-domain-containing protein [Fistulina hepatica ATCC 64428]|uniref:Peroxisomal ATPase PEX1 n=1 Tax=Fistulina hepatica ATCC 64428 TaxID=1128425 RepID=A0A0D7ARM6_9AGAR|nr:AAA-domain-containing protein [Fistulina hepatica ATCC 64428]